MPITLSTLRANLDAMPNHSPNRMRLITTPRCVVGRSMAEVAASCDGCVL